MKERIAEMPVENSGLAVAEICVGFSWSFGGGCM